MYLCSTHTRKVVFVKIHTHTRDDRKQDGGHRTDEMEGDGEKKEQCRNDQCIIYNKQRMKTDEHRMKQTESL